MEDKNEKLEELEAVEEIKETQQAPSPEEQEGEAAMHDVRIVSPAVLVFKRFFRSKLSVIGLVMFVLLFLFVFVGPTTVGWGETEVDRSGGQTTYTQYTTEFVGADGETYTVVQLNSYTPQINVFAPVFSYGTNADGEEVMHILGTDRSGMDIMPNINKN